MRGFINRKQKKNTDWQYAQFDGEAVSWCVYRIIDGICYVVFAACPKMDRNLKLVLPTSQRPVIALLESGGGLVGELYTLNTTNWALVCNGNGHVSFSYPVAE